MESLILGDSFTVRSDSFHYTLERALDGQIHVDAFLEFKIKKIGLWKPKLGSAVICDIPVCRSDVVHIQIS